VSFLVCHELIPDIYVMHALAAWSFAILSYQDHVLVVLVYWCGQ